MFALPIMTSTPNFALTLIIAATTILVLALRGIVRGFFRLALSPDRVLILGASPLASRIIEEIEAQAKRRYVIVGAADEGPPSAQASPRDFPVRPLGQLRWLVERLSPDRIVVAMTERRGCLPVRQLLDSRMRGVIVESAEEFYERLAGKLAIESFTPGGFLFTPVFRMSRLHLALGRALSVAAAAAALVVLAPVLAAVAVAIKLDSRGPVFFIQDRVGLNGRTFRLIKFRTMHGSRAGTSEWVRDNGHRITRVGKWLRRFRLDELPQCINVLRGEMNLVGPRPHPASNYELLATVARNVPERGSEIPLYSLRTLVRPGITGWAQVRYGYANGVEEEIEKLRYDLFYIKHLSVWLDLRILLETVRVVLLGKKFERAGAAEEEAAATHGGREASYGRQAGGDQAA